MRKRPGRSLSVCWLVAMHCGRSASGLAPIEGMNRRESDILCFRPTIDGYQSIKMSSNSAYPQDYPSHLSTDHDSGFCRTSPPAGCHTLPIDDLFPEQFEQLCWWLLRKDHQIVGCQRLGGNGNEQGGIDLYAFDKFEPSALMVYECKCWNEFPVAKLKGAITTFLEGHWANRVTSFTLIIAQESIDKLAKQWPIEKERLRKAGISNAELWTGAELTRRIERFPDILSKFFPGADITAFGNEWMQRVGFIERLNKALADPRMEINATAHTYLNTSGDSAKLDQEHVSENNWSLHKPWLRVECILPHSRFYPGSALLLFQRDDLQGASITVDQQWLLQNLICTPGAPLEHEFRPFISGVLTDAATQETKFIIDLKNCRCTLSTDATKALADAVDRLGVVFLDSLNRREVAWGASGFPFVNSRDLKVALCSMPKWLWQEILEFSQLHDIDSGDSEWYMFDRALGCLKPYTKESNETYKRGYHGVFYQSENLDSLTYRDEVTLLWSPPDISFRDEIGLQTWWSCEYAFKWIKDQLIPKIGEWRTRQLFEKARYIFSRNRKRRDALEWWKERALIRDIRSYPLLPELRCKAVGLYNTLVTLQEYFCTSRNDYFSTSEMEGLYHSLIVLLQSERGHLSYIAGNLSIHNVSSHSEVIHILDQRKSNKQFNVSCKTIDYTLRAMMEVVGNEDSWVCGDDLETVIDALIPLMKRYEQGMLILRHSKWL